MIRAGALAILLAAGACVSNPHSAPRLSDLDWIGGCWESEDHTQFERWGRIEGANRHGSGQLMRGGEVAFGETLRLEETSDGVIYWGAPEGQAPTAFALTAHGENWARFENPHHDDPKMIRYAREGESLRAWTANDGPERLVLDVRLSGCD